MLSHKNLAHDKCLIECKCTWRYQKRAIMGDIRQIDISNGKNSKTPRPSQIVGFKKCQPGNLLKNLPMRKPCSSPIAWQHASAWNSRILGGTDFERRKMLPVSWVDWSPWSVCVLHWQIRRRKCEKRPGHDCPGFSYEMQSCAESIQLEPSSSSHVLGKLRTKYCTIWDFPSYCITFRRSLTFTFTNNVILTFCLLDRERFPKVVWIQFG